MHLLPWIFTQFLQFCTRKWYSTDKRSVDIWYFCSEISEIFVWMNDLYLKLYLIILTILLLKRSKMASFYALKTKHLQHKETFGPLKPPTMGALDPTFLISSFLDISCWKHLTEQSSRRNNTFQRKNAPTTNNDN